MLLEARFSSDVSSSGGYVTWVIFDRQRFIFHISGDNFTFRACLLFWPTGKKSVLRGMSHAELDLVAVVLTTRQTA